MRAIGRREPGLHRPGVTAAESEEMSFRSSSNVTVSYKVRGHGSVVNTTKDSGSSANQLIAERFPQFSTEPAVHPYSL